MDFAWTDEQLEFREAVVAFARAELADDVAARDASGTFSRDLWRKCGEFGLLGSAFDERFGGAGWDILTTMLAMEALGYACRDNGLIFAMNAQMWAVQHPIQYFGTEEQKKRYLPRLCSGELIGAHGMTEPDSGSDAFALKTRAEPTDGGYRLRGTKTMVTNAPSADVFLVFATVDPALGRWGITAFLVERDTPGLGTGRNMTKLGLRTSTLGEVVLDDCVVPREARLGEEGAGVALFQSSMEWERACILGGHLGAMERQLEDCIRYANERKQFGEPIGRRQSVSNRIADMKVRLETARLLLYKVAWLKKNDRPAEMEAAMAKLYVSEAFVQSSLDAVRVHGGYGYLSEFGVERDLRDSVGGTLYSGTSDLQRVIIARLLGL